VTVRTDLDLPFEPDDLRARGDDKPRLKKLYERMEFRSWLRDIDGDGKTEVVPAEIDPADDEPEGRDYVTILSWEDFDAWLATITAAELTAFDTETTSLEPMKARLVGMSFAVEPGQAAYLPLAHRGADAPEQLPLDEVLGRLRPW